MKRKDFYEFIKNPISKSITITNYLDLKKDKIYRDKYALHAYYNDKEGSSHVAQLKI